MAATAVPITHDKLKRSDSGQWDWPLNHNDGIVKLQNLPDVFEVELEAVYFSPKEISVEVSGGHLIIKCQHDERTDSHGTISRSIYRSYRLPEDVDTGTITSHLSSRGVLRVSAKKTR